MSERASKSLRPIGDGDHEDLVHLLARAFPQDPPALWRTRLERQASLQKDGRGILLEVDGKLVGVLLTLRSRRTRPKVARWTSSISRAGSSSQATAGPPSR